MPRIRSVHPGLWTDEGFVSTSPLARLLLIGIWNECDDQGAFEWKPVTLKMRLLPADSVEVTPLLAELESADMVRRYQVEGRWYGACRNFARFQRPKKPHAIHPMPEPYRKYAGNDGGRPEPDDDETPEGSPPAPNGGAGVGKRFRTGGEPVPPTTEIAPQMEDGGGEKEEGGSVLDLPSQPPVRACPREDGGGEARLPGTELVQVSRAPPPLRSWSPPVGDEPATPTELACVAAWNALAERIPNLLPSRLIDRTRLRSLRQVLAVLGGVDGWALVLERVEESPLWRGEAGDTGWRPSLADALDQRKLAGLIEGSYAAWTRRPDQPLRNGAAEILRRLEEAGIATELPP